MGVGAAASGTSWSTCPTHSGPPGTSAQQGGVPPLSSHDGTGVSTTAPLPSFVRAVTLQSGCAPDRVRSSAIGSAMHDGENRPPIACAKGVSCCSKL